MPDIPRIPISQMIPADSINSNTLFESAIPDGIIYITRKVTLNQISEYINKIQTFIELTTTSKTVVGGINELVTAIQGLTQAVQALQGETVTGTLLAGQTSLTLNATSIPEGSDIVTSTSIFGVTPKSQIVVDNNIVMEFNAQSTDLGVKVVIL